MSMTQGYSDYLAFVEPWIEPSALQENNDKDKGNTGKEKLWTFCTVDFNTIQSGLGIGIALAWPCAQPDIEQAEGMLLTSDLSWALWIVSSTWCQLLSVEAAHG